MHLESKSVKTYRKSLAWLVVFSFSVIGLDQYLFSHHSGAQFSPLTADHVQPYLVDCRTDPNKLTEVLKQSDVPETLYLNGVCEGSFHIDGKTLTLNGGTLRSGNSEAVIAISGGAAVSIKDSVIENSAISVSNYSKLSLSSVVYSEGTDRSKQPNYNLLVDNAEVVIAGRVDKLALFATNRGSITFDNTVEGKPSRLYLTTQSIVVNQTPNLTIDESVSVLLNSSLAGGNLYLNQLRIEDHSTVKVDELLVTGYLEINSDSLLHTRHLLHTAQLSCHGSHIAHEDRVLVARQPKDEYSADDCQIYHLVTRDSQP
ncbi:hypothetical protein [Vibrio hippocampi]|uniref:Auto-transporter adhesin head GIN domain-containing protein n=1 Tax=Vibrio hippocampi TaxID=654686 RepID=A0ABM8ZMB4_9VIBR|nr:hypothetical protein [Vibrio hippocampi]CAH0529599.1 hypothetical protein VHP8226_03354 [Vibrio hippocampi]